MFLCTYVKPVHIYMVHEYIHSCPNKALCMCARVTMFYGMPLVTTVHLCTAL